MNKKIKELEKKLNLLWSKLPKKPTYNEFNSFFPFDENVPFLRQFERENKWVGIANYSNELEGISVISLIASIVDFLTDGTRLAVITEKNEEHEDPTIIGFQFLNINLEKNDQNRKI
jgi:hypothetical protein